MLAMVRRNLRHFWRTNLAVLAGAAVAVAVLSGALLVGASVRGSLRALALARLGNAEQVIASPTFFTETLAQGLEATVTVEAACPIVLLDGFVTHPGTGRRAGGVTVYGVDARFWDFHGVGVPTADARLDDDGVLASVGLAAELGAVVGDDLLVRLEKPSDVPPGWLHGSREDVARTLRLTLRAIPEARELGDFSLRPGQGVSRVVFVSLARVQRDLQLVGRVNTILVGARAGERQISGTEDAEHAAARDTLAALQAAASLEDRGVRLRRLPEPGVLQVESATGIMSEPVVAAAEAAAVSVGMGSRPALTYLVNRVSLGSREASYALLAGLDLQSLPVPGVDGLAGAAESGVVLNTWLAEELEAAVGDSIQVEYFVWEDQGRLVTRSASLPVLGITPIEGVAADADLAPRYPGITEADSLAEWDPPFPVDLSRVGPRDEEYWERYRTTPKGFVSLASGQRLWASRYGRVTSVRVDPPDGADLDASTRAYETALRDALDPVRAGFQLLPVRGRALDASVGATDFGQYFTYFSFFIVVSALLLMVLFFRLGIEQRLREIGVLRALGFPTGTIRRVFLVEGVVLSGIGGAVGTVGAVAYAAVIMYGLRHWWFDAVGTTQLTLHLSGLALAVGGIGGVVAALGCIGVTLRSVATASPRSLIAGTQALESRSTGDPLTADGRGGGSQSRHPWRAGRGWCLGLGASAIAMAVAAGAGLVAPVAGFFVAGTLMLGAWLVGFHAWLSGRGPGLVRGTGFLAVGRFGLRNTAYRPWRSVLCIALIASAAFIIVAVDAFRREGAADVTDIRSGGGGFSLLAESTLPVLHDLDSAEGRESFGLVDAGPERPRLHGFRLRAGEDASCLNLYRPENPRVLGAPAPFVNAGRFAFGQTLAADEAERRNPWLLLERTFSDGAVPAIADATSLAYALHLSVGDDLVVSRGSERPVTLRFVAALTDSVFQSEVLVSDGNFLRLFPAEEGFRFFLIDVDPDSASAVTAELEERLSDVGFDVSAVADRIAGYHRVENTYLATFQALGGLGLLLGTFGLAAVLMRNVIERRRELALLRAVGYESRHLALMVLSENAFLLVGGLVAGTVSAAVAIAPAWLERGGGLATSVLGLLLAVSVTGMVASVVATRVALRAPLILTLRGE